MKYFWLIPLVGMVFGNFSYQMFSVDPNYATAIERSYFQVIAVLVCIAFDRISNKV